jgi:serine/threonine-protein kinase
MNFFLSDLEGALEVEVSRAGHSTGEATTVLDSVPSKRRRFLTKRRISWAGALLLIAAAGAALAIAALTGDSGSSRAGDSDDPGVAGNEPVAIAAAVDFDPAPGDGSEHSDEVLRAIDSNPSGTAWTSETYTAGLGDKEGVGLILEAEEEVTPSELSIRTPAPGWTAEIYGATGSPPSELDGWGEPLAPAVEITADEQAIQLDAIEANQYFLIWVTELAPAADGAGGFRVEISDARLFS